MAFWTSLGSGPLDAISFLSHPEVLKEVLRNMEVHWLVTLLTSTILRESGASTLDLHTTPSFLLNMLDVGT